MPTQQKNFGIANVKVEILDKLPYVVENRRYNMDVIADMLPSFLNSRLVPPILTELIQEQNDGFSAWLPEKRRMMVDNYLADGSVVPPGFTGPLPEGYQAPSGPYILWTPVTEGGITIPGTIGTISNNWPEYALIMPRAGVRYETGYLGPEWDKTYMRYEAQPDDDATLRGYFELLDSESESSQSEGNEDALLDEEEADAPLVKVAAITLALA